MHIYQPRLITVQCINNGMVHKPLRIKLISSFVIQMIEIKFSQITIKNQEVLDSRLVPSMDLRVGKHLRTY